MKYLLLLLAVTAFVVLVRPFLHAGYPYTHDGENHLARIANYATALKQGQFPPRWAPNFWSGYGYPVFNYNYPLANIVSAPFVAAQIPVETTLKIVQILALLAGSVGVYFYLREELGKEAAFVGVIGYLTAPFLFNNLYVRGAVGEVMAYAVLPHALYAVNRFVRSRSVYTASYFFLSTLALMLAHNIFVLLLVPLLALYLLYMLRNVSYSVRLQSVGVFVCGVAASMFFWLPALMEKSLVWIDESTFVQQTANHFPTISQLLTSPFSFGYSIASPVDSLSFNLGTVLLGAAVVLAALVSVQRNLVSKKQLAVLVFFFASILLMLPQSAPVWNVIPLLRYLQFPWRMLFLTSIFGAYLLPVLYARLQGKQKWLVVIPLLLTVAGMGQKVVSTYIHRADDFYVGFTQTSTVQDENKPKTLKKFVGDIVPQLPSFDGDATTEVVSWNGTRREYIVHAGSAQYVTEPTTYFPGWIVQVDGKDVVIEHERSEGLITYLVPAGEHRVVTRFTQRTPARVFGNSLSMLALAAFGVYIFLLQKHHNGEQIPTKPKRSTRHDAGRKRSA